MLMNYYIGRLVLSSLCVGAFVAVDIWWCSFCRLKPVKRTPQRTQQDDRCGNSSTQSQAPEDGYINVRNMLSA